MNKCKLKRKSTLTPLASFDAEGFSVSEIKRFKKLLFISLLLSSFFLYGAAFAANSTPLAGAVTPASGTSNPNVAVHFTTTFSDRDGWQNIQYTCLLVNKDTSGANCCYVYYNQNTNKLYLRNDSDTRWLGGYTPGSS